MEATFAGTNQPINPINLLINLTMGKISLKVALQDMGALHTSGYITRANRYTLISAEEVIQLAAQNSGINPGQMAAAMYAVQQTFNNFLCNGHSVELLGVGTFKFNVNCHLAATPEEAGADAVYRRKILFRPSAYMRRQLNETTLTVGESPEE